MSNLIAKITTAAVLSFAIATPGLAADPSIKARKALMQLYKFNVSQLGGMAKGAIPYDAKTASAAANNLKTLVSLNQEYMWPAGTDNNAMPGETRALPAMWTDYPAVENNIKAMAAAADTMAASAGTDLASLQGAMGALGASCSGCHKKFRGPKN